MNWFKEKYEYVSSIKWGAFGVGISFIKVLCLLPAFLYAVDMYTYSFWILLTALSILVGSVSLGHFHFGSNYFNLSYHKGESPEKVFRVINSANLFYLGFQLLIIVLLCIPGYKVLFPKFSEAFANSNHAVACLMLLSVSKTLSLYSSMFLVRLLEPLGKVRQTLKIQFLGDLTDLIVTIVVILATADLLAISLAAAVASIIFFILVVVYVQKQLGFKLFVPEVNFKEAVLFIRNSLLLNVSFFLEKIYEQGIHLIVLCFFYEESLPVFNTARTVSNIFFRFSLIAILPVFPVIQKYYAQGGYTYVVSVLKKFWTISAVLIVCLIAIGYPFLPYVYNVWTKGKIDYNEVLMGALFIGVLFQNFASIGYELFKKVNYSKEILLLNILRVITMCVCILWFGYYAYLPGLGFSFSIAEFLCCLLSLFFLGKMFKEDLRLVDYSLYILPFVVFSLSLIGYMWYSNYMLVLAGGIISLWLTFSRFKEILKSL